MKNLEKVRAEEKLALERMKVWTCLSNGLLRYEFVCPDKAGFHFDRIVTNEAFSFVSVSLVPLYRSGKTRKHVTLQYVTLYYVTLCYVALCCTTLCYVVLRYTTLCCVILRCVVLRCLMLRYSTVRYVTVRVK